MLTSLSSVSPLEFLTKGSLRPSTALTHQCLDNRLVSILILSFLQFGVARAT